MLIKLLWTNESYEAVMSPPGGLLGGCWGGIKNKQPFKLNYIHKINGVPIFGHVIIVRMFHTFSFSYLFVFAI